MHLNVLFQDEFETIAKGTKISVDTEGNETVENFKVLLSLVYRDLDVDHLKLFYGTRSLRDSDRLHEVKLKDGDTVKVMKKKYTYQCFPFLR